MACVYCGLGLMSAPIAAALSEEDDEAFSGPVFFSDQIDQLPQMGKCAPPKYPFQMRLALLEGEVLIEFIIDTKGRVRNAQVIRSSNPWFERSALRAINRWKFKPGLKNGIPINTARVQQMITFRINDGGGWRLKKGKDHSMLPANFQWDTPPKPTLTTFPVYPFELLRAGTKGKTRITCIIGPEGKLQKTTLQEATTPEMGMATLAMMDAWEFKPARKADGTPCSAVVVMEHIYTPSGRDSVPVSDYAALILRDLERNPASIALPQDLDQALQVRTQRKPVFPSALADTVKSGQAVIEFFIDKNGDAQLPRIISCTAPQFGYAAVQAIVAWRYVPPRKGGKRTVVRVQVPVDFSPADQNPASNPPS